MALETAQRLLWLIKVKAAIEGDPYIESMWMNRLEREVRTLELMLDAFCRHHHGRPNSLCGDCSELARYADYRLSRCPYGPEKPTCANCPIHCYSPERREQVREVMHWAGPQMLRRHPILAIMHLIDGRRRAPESRRKKRNSEGS